MNELIDGIIVGLNSALSHLYSGQNIAFCNKIGEIGHMLSALQAEIRALENRNREE